MGSSWQEQKGTLNDESIFGPFVDYQCACKRYCGKDYNGVICDICGVKIMSSREGRTSRFGHINLSVMINHAICDSPVLLDCFPVLPDCIRSSHSGKVLNSLYEHMIVSSESKNDKLTQYIYDDIVCVLSMTVIMALNWGLQDTLLLAKGMALQPL